MAFWWPLLVLAFAYGICRFLLMLIPPKVPSIDVDVSDVLDDGNQAQENSFIYVPPRGTSQQSGKIVQCYEPATMKYLGYVPALTHDEVKDRVAKVRKAQKMWAKSSFKQRRLFLRILLKYIIKHQALICEISSRDTGKTMVDASLGEIMTTCEKIHWLLSEGEHWLKPEYRSSGRSMLHKRAKVEFHPLGVIGAIVSWNYPFHNIFNPMLAAIFSGNGIVIKISEHASWSGCFYFRIIQSALAAIGAPEDLVEVITGYAETGEALVSSVDKVIFVGSPGVGKMIMRNAAETLIPVTLELGGKDAFIVCEDVDVDHVAQIAVRAALQSSGQNCAGNLSEEERASYVQDLYQNTDEEVDFELFLKVYLKLQTFVSSRTGSSPKNSSAFLKAATTTLLHTISESEKASYVSHINHYLAQDEFLKKYLPIDPSTNELFEIAKDGVLLCKLINVAVPGTIDERAINTKRLLNPWERNENHTLCLNSAKAIGCTVVNIGTQDFIEGRRHLVLGLISQIIKIQLLADLNLKKTPQLLELLDDSKDMEELMNLPPEKILLRWMNFHLKKAGYKKIVTNFSSDVKDAEAYAHLLNVLAPEYTNPSTLAVKNPFERAKLVLEHSDKMGCKRYLTARDIVEGSPNLNLAFVAHIFQHRNGLPAQTKQISLLETLPDDTEDSREERAFRLWINSLGNSTYINNVFEDLRNGWVLLETLDKVSPGIVHWKIANKPPIKMPFKKVENCNQVVKIGKQLKFSLVNVAGNDIVQGNKKLILAYLWQLMRYNILQLLKNLRFHSHGKEITDADILQWANSKVCSTGSQSRIDSFKDKSLSDGIFFLELLSSVQPRAVNWGLVTKGVTDEEKKMNATYIISIARKLGCSIFLLPEDITEVNQKMILTLTASIMSWFLKHPHEERTVGTSDSESGSQLETTSNSTLDDSASESSVDENGNM